MVQTGAQLGPYRLLRRIGSGGMAEVFLGQRIGAEGFARTVAVKTILAMGAEEEGIGLFLDEARVAAYLDHAAIVQTLDLGFENDVLFIVMEYVAGPALSRIIRDLRKHNRFLSPQVVAYVGARVAAALDYGHRRATTPEGQLLKLVHRDISPQNILITRAGLVKLTDFGVARASIQTHRTRTGQVRGKAAYMAPEQVRAGQLDGRTDVFALALVLFEALTGVRAYQRKTDIMSMRAILTDPLPPIRETNPNVPTDLEDVIKRALAKKPDERYANAAEMAEALLRTIRSRSEAAIEAELTRTIEELFGPQQFPAEGEIAPVEAWQPAANAQAEQDKIEPHRIPGAKLSPKIQALLQGPQPDPLDDIDISTSSSGEGVGYTPSVISVTPTSGGRTGAMGPVERFHGPAGTPLPFAGSQLSPAPMAFSELAQEPGGVSFVPSGPAATALYPPPGTSVLTDPRAGEPQRGLLLVTGGLAAVAALGVVLFFWSRAEPTPVPEQPNFVKLPDADPPRSKPLEPRPAESRPAESRPVESRQVESRPVEGGGQHPEQPRREPQDRREPRREPKEPQHPREERPAASEAPKEQKNDKDSFLKRALEARNKSGTDSELGKELTHMINNHLQDRERAITSADRELVKRAEQSAH